MTYTYALLEISPPAFNEIAQKMAKAGSQQAFHDDKEHGKLIDMRGIAVVPDRQMKPGEHYLELRSILSDRAKQGRVELRVDNVVVQMDLDKAREVLGMLSGAIEAVSDKAIDKEPGEWETKSSLNRMFEGQPPTTLRVALSCSCDCHGDEPNTELNVVYDRSLGAIVVECPTCLGGPYIMCFIPVGDRH